MNDEGQQGDVQAALAAGREAVQVIDILPDEGGQHAVKVLVRPDGDGTSVAEVHDLEQYADGPRRARGNVTITDVAGFAEYVKRHRDSYTVIFANDHGGMKAVFNHHAEGQTAGWRDLTATLVRPRTPGFEAWIKASTGWMRQLEFANFLEERLVDIADPDGASLLDTAEHFRAHTIVRFRSQQRLRDGQTQLEYIEVVEGGSGEGEGKLTLPDKLTVVLQPFRDSQPFRVDARLRWRVQERQVTFAVLFDDTLMDELETVYDATIDEVAKATGAPVFRGTDA